MKLPQNVVPMPAEKRAELKRLAEAATSLNEPWASAYLGQYADYALATGPDVALATLAYVGALERNLDRATRLNAILSTSNSGLREEIDELLARATKAETQAAALQGELAEQGTAALQWAKTLAEYSNEISRLRTANDDAERRFQAEQFKRGAFFDQMLEASILTDFEQQAYQWAQGYCGYPDQLAAVIKRYRDAVLAPTPLPSSPDAAGPVKPAYPNSTFATEAEHDELVLKAAEKMEAGEGLRTPQVDAAGPEEAVPSYEEVTAAAERAGWGRYMLTRETFDSLTPDNRKLLFADTVSGRLRDKVMDALNLPVSSAPTTTGEGKEVAGE